MKQVSGFLLLILSKTKAAFVATTARRLARVYAVLLLLLRVGESCFVFSEASIAFVCEYSSAFLELVAHDLQARLQVCIDVGGEECRPCRAREPIFGLALHLLLLRGHRGQSLLLGRGSRSVLTRAGFQRRVIRVE